MPKSLFKSFFIVSLMVYWFNGLIVPVHAFDLTNTATTSATATVPSTAATTGDTTAPSTPILIRPEGGTLTSNNKPEFVWRKSTDPNGNSLTYTLYLNSVATYLGVSNIGNSTGNGYTARIDGEELKLLPTLALADGSYTWYVAATDISGNTARSTIWSFTVDTTAPPLTLVDLDTYHEPTITTGANFDITGPKDVNFTILSDPNTSIQITITSSLEPLHLNSLTNANGLVYFNPHLLIGNYTITILSIDPSGNSTFLPDFTVTIAQAEIVIILPGSSPPVLTIPYTPVSLSSLPATIQNIQSRQSLPYLLSILLAVITTILLNHVWKRKYNLILLGPEFKPIQSATIYHSIPNLKSNIYHLESLNHGRLYIPRLGRYSTLTIRLQSDTTCTTYILSISAKRKQYTLILG